MCDFRNVNNDVAEAMNLSALEGLEERFSHQVSFAPLHNCFLSFTSIIPIGAGSNKRNWRNAFAPPTVSKTAFKKTPASTETLYPSGIKVYHQVSGTKVIREAFSTAPACQELKSMRTPALLPDSIMARLRPSPRTGSTAVVLWKPPPPSGSLLPDLVRPCFKKFPYEPDKKNFKQFTHTPKKSVQNVMPKKTGMHWSFQYWAVLLDVLTDV